jgi:hypothetical protein
LDLDGSTGAVAPSHAALIADYEWFRQHSGLTEPVDFDRVIDESYVQHAIGVLGAYR